MRYALLVAGSFFAVASAQAAMLDPASVDPARLLPPPPAADSVDAKAEFQELHDIAKRSSPELLAMAKHDAENETPTLYNGVVGFDIKTLPQTYKLLSLVANEEDEDTKTAKAYFHRDRPYAIEPALKTCTAIKPGKAANSYPSGHASLAFSVGIVLASLMPAKSQAILARASEYAERRLICGVHFRSDIVAGQQFGTILALRLMEKPEFRTLMAAAQAELKTAGK